MNIGVIRGQCVSSEPFEGSDTKRIYFVKPSILGKFGSPIKVLSPYKLIMNREYAFSGVIDTVKHNKILIPVLRVFVVNKINSLNSSVKPHGPNDYDRVKAASFFFMDNLTVSSTMKVKRDCVIEMSKISEAVQSKVTNVLHLYGLTTYYTREKSCSLKKGDSISVIGCLHSDPGFSDRSKKRELGIRIFKINPTAREVEEILSGGMISNLLESDNNHVSAVLKYWSKINDDSAAVQKIV